MLEDAKSGCNAKSRPPSCTIDIPFDDRRRRASPTGVVAVKDLSHSCAGSAATGDSTLSHAILIPSRPSETTVTSRPIRWPQSKILTTAGPRGSVGSTGTVSASPALRTHCDSPAGISLNDANKPIRRRQAFSSTFTTPRLRSSKRTREPTGERVQLTCDSPMERLLYHGLPRHAHAPCDAPCPPSALQSSFQHQLAAFGELRRSQPNGDSQSTACAGPPPGTDERTLAAQRPSSAYWHQGVPRPGVEEGVAYPPLLTTSLSLRSPAINDDLRR